MMMTVIMLVLARLVMPCMMMVVPRCSDPRFVRIALIAAVCNA